jgi:hypothetical protein
MANWTVVLQTFFSAYMNGKRPCHAGIAIHAMKVIDAQSLPHSAEVTVRAVVDFPIEHIPC